MENSSSDWNISNTIAIIGILVGAGLTIFINREKIYPLICPGKFKKRRALEDAKLKKSDALKDFRKLKTVCLNDFDNIKPLQPGNTKDPSVSQKIAQKLSDDLSRWLAENDIETDKSYAHLSDSIEKLKEHIQDVVNPKRAGGGPGILSDPFNNAIIGIPKILEQIEKQLVENM